ncbi:MAG: shikimate dehydrogenase [Anaerolineales bacterium]|nr:shikimate dehydrogenase [Anaerolineales bacterium]
MKAVLIGWPIRHSVSPAMHDAALRALGLSGGYSLLPVEREAELEQVLAKLKSDPDWSGANVTVPYKEKILPHLDRLEGAAAELRAANTVVRRGAELIGHNTDLPGFLADLERNGMDSRGKPALVIGSGGAARAVVLGLVQSGCPVTIVAVIRDQARTLAAELGGGRVDVLGWEDPELIERARGAGLIVNASPAGMWPAVQATPWPSALPLPESACVYDLVYNPIETRFLREAKLRGNRTASGLGMLVEQGALSFELWTGVRAPREAMMSAARAAMEAEERQ